MQKHIGWLSVAECFGLLATANAQTPPVAAVGTRFDGTYAFVSGTNVNETYLAGIGRVGSCPANKKAGALHIVNGRARLSNGPGYHYEGTIGPQGELAMRLVTPAVCSKCSLGVEIMVNGRIEGNGTVKARRMDYRCSYDLIWRKVSK
jgi:hypothetical protein